MLPTLPPRQLNLLICSPPRNADTRVFEMFFSLWKIPPAPQLLVVTVKGKTPWLLAVGRTFDKASSGCC